MLIPSAPDDGSNMENFAAYKAKGFNIMAPPCTLATPLAQ